VERGGRAYRRRVREGGARGNGDEKMKGVEQAALWAMLFVGLYWAACNCNHDGHMYRGPSHPSNSNAAAAAVCAAQLFRKIFSSPPSIFKVHAKHLTPLDFTKP
jgi:hypothetical protein